MRQEDRDHANEQSYNLSEAAAVTGASRITMRRRLDAGRFPSAFRDTSTLRRPPPWRIPALDLIAAGFTIRDPASDTELETAASGLVEKSALEPAERVAVAEAVAAERAHTIELLVEVNRRLVDAVVEVATQGQLSSRDHPRRDQPEPRLGDRSP